MELAGCRMSRYDCRCSRYRRMDMPKPTGLLQESLDLLILRTITRQPLHGWGIAERMQILSRDVLSVAQGSLSPALHRLEQQGWITAEWKESDLNRPAKFTREARNQVERELKLWERLSSAVHADPKSLRPL